LGLLPAPEILLESEAYPRVEELIVGLQRRSSLLIIDLASGDAGLTGSVLHACDLILLVSTPDAPALRAASRWRGVFPPEEHTGAGLILNQMSRDHPMRPNAVATSLSLPLLGVLPKDMEAVGSQIAFGQPAVLSQGSPLGRAMLALATRVSQQLGVLGRKLKAAGSSPPPHTAGGIQEDASS
jgi:Flp pilus assembly CpaE family ATPase